MLASLTIGGFGGDGGRRRVTAVAAVANENASNDSQLVKSFSINQQLVVGC